MDTQRAGRSRVSPDDRIVTTDPGAVLDKAAKDRESPMHVDSWHETPDLIRAQNLRVDTVDANGVAPAPDDLHLMFAVCEVDQSSLAQHDIEVQLGGQALVQTQRMIVEGGARRVKVVRADDLSVAAGITATDPSALQHRDLAHSMLARQVVRGRQSVATPAYDHDVIGFPEDRLAPCRLPAP